MVRFMLLYYKYTILDIFFKLLFANSYKLHSLSLNPLHDKQNVIDINIGLIYIVLLCGWFAIINSLNAQQNIPVEYFTDYFIAARKAIETENDISEIQAKNYYKKMYDFKREIFINNKIYDYNGVSMLVRRIKDYLLQDHESLKSEIKIYVTRIPEQNAFALVDGSIFIHIGMMAKLQNESQLAYIIAHEIAHYKFRHSISILSDISKIKREEKKRDRLSSAIQQWKFLSSKRQATHLSH